MRMSLAEVIDNIGYSRVIVFTETPLGESNFEMIIAHITESGDGYYIEDVNGNSLWLSKGLDADYENEEYHIAKDNCQICIKLNT